MNIRKTFLTLLLLVSILGFSSCKKTKNGVLEIRTSSLLIGTNGSTGLPSVTTIFNDNFKCVIATDDNYTDGEIKTFLVNGSNFGGPGATKMEYIYHSGESAKSLGYTEKSEKDVSFSTPFGTFDSYYTSKEGNGIPGKKSGFGRLCGKWKHTPTELIIWIDSDNEGKALLVNGGTSAPADAVGGFAWKEINNIGSNSYRFLNQIWYPNTGWIDGSYMNLELEKDGTSFKVNGQTYNRVPY
jgi:hypothetical protein